MKRACLATIRLFAPCRVCGIRATPVHTPMVGEGFYCGACCPHCKAHAGSVMQDLAADSGGANVKA